MGFLAAVEMRYYLGGDYALEWHLQCNHYPPISLDFLPVAKKALELARNGDFSTKLLLPNRILQTVGEVLEGLHLHAFLDGEDA